jgi:hypothetical protein
MISLQIKVTKSIMNALLASECFDTFLLEEANVTTFNTFHIDGHIVKDFYTAEELSELPCAFSLWRDIRPFCFQLIKGKKTPVSFKVVLHAPAGLVEKIAADPACGVAANLIRALALNIRYNNGHVMCVTGCAYSTFLMDKSAEKLWDAYVRRMFSGLNIDFEEQ